MRVSELLERYYGDRPDMKFAAGNVGMRFALFRDAATNPPATLEDQTVRFAKNYLYGERGPGRRPRAGDPGHGRLQEGDRGVQRLAREADRQAVKAEVVLQEVLYVRGDVEWLRARCGGPALSDKKRVVAYLRRGRVYKGMSTVDRDLLGDGGGRRRDLHPHRRRLGLEVVRGVPRSRSTTSRSRRRSWPTFRERGFRMPRKAALHRLEIAQEVVERDGLA